MHATETQLALFSTGDLGLAERLRVRLHVSHCERCRQELALFEETRSIVESEGQLAPGGEWNRLAAEMTANIRLGVEAGEIVRRTPAEPVITRFAWPAVWRPALAIASLVVVLYGGTWVAAQKLGANSRAHSSSAQQMTLEARPDALEIRGDGTAFSLVRATAAPVAMSLGSGGSIAARELDEDTGQVTIYHVYAQ